MKKQEKKKLTLKTVLSELNALRKLLAKGWTRKALARDKYGNRVAFSSPRAAKFCLVGGMFRLGTSEKTRSILAEMSEVVSVIILAVYNDKSTKAEVLELIDACAISVKKRIR